MFDSPSCPECGWSLLVREVHTGRFFLGHTLDKYELHRCYRCLTTFSAVDDVDPEGVTAVDDAE